MKKKKVLIWVLVVLAIVVFSVVSVLIREEVIDCPTWVIWVLGAVLVGVVGFLRSKE